MSKERNENKVSKPTQNENCFLIAEDNIVDATIVSAMVSQAFCGKYELVHVDCFEKARSALAERQFTALILDMNLPDQSGIANIREVSESYPDLPIVVLTGADDTELAVDALQNGAQDYLSKNDVNPEILSRSLRYSLERKHIELQLKQALLDTAQRNIQLDELVKQDPLTKLPNRTFFIDIAAQVVAQARRKDRYVALLFIDIDSFKKVNDTYGHITGDKLLKFVADRLASVIRDSDMLARFGSDEFVVVTDLLESKNDVYPLVKRILSQFEKSFDFERFKVMTHPSIGVAFFPEAEDVDQLVKHADSAMFEAKRSSDSHVCFYSDRLADRFSRNQKIESALGDALNQGELCAWFQPVQSTTHPEEIGVEALIRWESSELGRVSPDEFIPLAEFTPAITEITRLILSQGKLLKNQLQPLGLHLSHYGVNISATQLNNHHFSKHFLEWLDECQLDPTEICLELTERQIVENASNCSKQLAELREKGVEIALDDFGSGYSSITHLLELPLDILKLDRLLIDRIDENHRNQALTAGIIEMGHRLEMTVVAEGIERAEEQKILEDLKCDYLQGYFICKPKPLEEVILHYKKD